MSFVETVFSYGRQWKHWKARRSGASATRSEESDRGLRVLLEHQELAALVWNSEEADLIARDLAIAFKASSACSSLYRFTARPDLRIKQHRAAIQAAVVLVGAASIHRYHAHPRRDPRSRRSFRTEVALFESWLRPWTIAEQSVR